MPWRGTSLTRWWRRSASRRGDPEARILPGAEDHGPAALFGGMMGGLELDRADDPRPACHDVTRACSPGTSKEEVDKCWASPRELMNGRSGMSEAQARLREAAGVAA